MVFKPFFGYVSCRGGWLGCCRLSQNTENPQFSWSVLVSQKNPGSKEAVGYAVLGEWTLSYWYRRFLCGLNCDYSCSLKVYLWLPLQLKPLLLSRLSMLMSSQANHACSWKFGKFGSEWWLRWNLMRKRNWLGRPTWRRPIIAHCQERPWPPMWLLGATVKWLIHIKWQLSPVGNWCLSAHWLPLPAERPIIRQLRPPMPWLRLIIRRELLPISDGAFSLHITDSFNCNTENPFEPRKTALYSFVSSIVATLCHPHSVFATFLLDQYSIYVLDDFLSSVYSTVLLSIVFLVVTYLVQSLQWLVCIPSLVKWEPWEIVSVCSCVYLYSDISCKIWSLASIFLSDMCNVSAILQWMPSWVSSCCSSLCLEKDS